MSALRCRICGESFYHIHTDGKSYINNGFSPMSNEEVWKKGIEYMGGKVTLDSMQQFKELESKICQQAS